MLVEEGSAVPDCQGGAGDGGVFVVVIVSSGEVEVPGGVEEDLVRCHEDAGAEFDGLGGVVVDVDGGGAAADVGVAVEEGDVDREACFPGEVGEVVG